MLADEEEKFKDKTDDALPYTPKYINNSIYSLLANDADDY